MRRQFNQLGAFFFTRFPQAGRMWAKLFPAQRRNASIPWTAFRGSLAQTKWALITTGGPHLADDLPFNMDDSHGDPSFRVIPPATPLSTITITHDYYNHSDADRDLNIILPLTRFHELTERGIIGGLGTCYGFMGHITDQHIDTLINQTAPAVARRLRDEGVTAVLLTPA